MKFILAIFATLVVTTGHADTLSGRVINIADGDTLTLLDASNTQHKIRLSGIDAPERGQPFGTVSGEHLGKLVFGEHVTIDYDKRDRYGRIVGKVIIGRQDVNLEQTAAGLAWHFKEYQHEQSSLDRQLYALTEQQARRNEIGLWSERYPVAPWDWRKGVRDGSPGAAVRFPDGACAKRTCSTFPTCADAMNYMHACGGAGIDGDADSVPCESMCR